MKLEILDISNLPLVRVQKFPETMVEIKTWIDEIEYVISLGSGYSLYYPSVEVVSEKNRDIVLGRRLLSLWLKRGKERFRESFKSIIAVAIDEEHHVQLQELAPTLAGIYGVPCYVARNEQDVQQAVKIFENLFFV